MAKRVLPVHLDERERSTLQRVATGDGISMAEVVRRLIRRNGDRSTRNGGGEVPTMPPPEPAAAKSITASRYSHLF